RAGPREQQGGQAERGQRQKRGQGRSAGGHGGQYPGADRPVKPSPASPASLFFGPAPPPPPSPAPGSGYSWGNTTGRARGGRGEADRRGGACRRRSAEAPPASS